MSTKKIVIGITSLAAVFMAGLTLYVYTRNFGVDYKGRARLDYNWKYYFTECPKESYQYDGELFSFEYPQFSSKTSLREVIDAEGGMVSDGYLLDIFWDNHTEKRIKSELQSYLSTPNGEAVPKPSAGFVKWLFGDGVHPLVHFEKVSFGGGGGAISLLEQGNRYDYLLTLPPGGNVFKILSKAPYNMPEGMYRELMFAPHLPVRDYPDPERDAKNICVQKRFLKTFKFKK